MKGLKAFGLAGIVMVSVMNIAIGVAEKRLTPVFTGVIFGALFLARLVEFCAEADESELRMNR